jgi:ribonuclease HI
MGRHFQAKHEVHIALGTLRSCHEQCNAAACSHLGAIWIQRGWKTGNGTPVANKELWKSLLKDAERHRHVEWTWVNAHSGKLLNECADVLAIRGILNERPPNDRPQVLAVIE